jgi:uncharacterized protein YcbK (DUF882 family)
MTESQLPSQKANPAVSDKDVSDLIQLSKNLYLHELDCHDGTEVPEKCIDDLKRFADRNFQPYRDAVEVPVRILSGYRHPEYNKRVGGTPKSFHQYGHFPNRSGMFAIDITTQGIEPVAAYIIVRALMRAGVMQLGGLGLYSWGIHYDNRGAIVEF